MTFPIIQTPRLTLRQLTLADSSAIFALRSNPEVAAFQDRPLQQNLEESAAFIDKINTGIDRETWIFWAITLQETAELIGTACLWNFSEEKTRADLGYELLPTFQGSGYMLEALKPVLDYGFTQLQQIDGVTHKNNDRSTQLLKKLNFTLNPDFADGNEIMYTIKKRS
ncbi:GNAT family N-acetyltransferase [Paenilisteria newyorkensis]|uniref:GNAT family N-acetyltransferase n=1 Tax=Listeria newyorkensis TaxID=1497681 RepID=UPI00066A02BD|nr:GNAT family N-acetyltransferase [Listeria newyorkensis]KMT62875.1 N-acetyltransferase GCN5 [Listeria newyorkensis]